MLFLSVGTLDRLAEAVVCMEDDGIADMALQHCCEIGRSRAHVDLGTTFEWKQGLDHRVTREPKQLDAALSSATPQCRARLARSGVVNG